MELAVNHTEEKDSNWADLIDGLRYGEFRRSVSKRGALSESSDVGAAGSPAPITGATHAAPEPNPS